MNGQTIVDAILREGGFDSNAANATRPTILSWANEAMQNLVAGAEWLKSSVELGPTVANQSQYLVPATVIQVKKVRVTGVGSTRGRRYTLASTDELWDLQDSDAYISPAGRGVFTAQFEADTDPVIELYPAPTVAGYSINALCVVKATDMTDSTGSLPQVPDDFHQDIVDEGMGIGFDRIYERADLSAPKHAKFATRVVDLKRRGKSRIGSGPQQIRVAGRYGS